MVGILLYYMAVVCLGFFICKYDNDFAISLFAVPFTLHVTSYIHFLCFMISNILSKNGKATLKIFGLRLPSPLQKGGEWNQRF